MHKEVNAPQGDLHPYTTVHLSSGACISGKIIRSWRCTPGWIYFTACITCTCTTHTVPNFTARKKVFPPMRNPSSCFLSSLKRAQNTLARMLAWIQHRTMQSAQAMPYSIPKNCRDELLKSGKPSICSSSLQWSLVFCWTISPTALQRLSHQKEV